MAQSASAFSSPEQFQRSSAQLLAGLLNLGRHTVTGALTTAGWQQRDWSSAYRDCQRLPIGEMFGAIRTQAQSLLPARTPWVVAIDDSVLRKTGRRIPGTAWRRDPLSPPFNVNFTWGQRVLQFSAALPQTDGSARMVPIDFRQAPTPRRPRSCDSPEAFAAYREACRQTNLNRVTVEAMQQLHCPDRPIHFVVDGRFTNKTLLRNLPNDTTLIGRIRKDTVFHALPSPLKSGRGRPRRYGAPLPTPEELRRDDTIPWQRVRAWAVNRYHQFEVKTLGPVRARISGADRDVRLIVIAPLAYRLRKAGETLYRRPAYLICTDPNLPLTTVLQEYVWRWEIEVNFRDEKTLLGIGEAQIRNPKAVAAQPAAIAATYAWLLLAAQHAFPDQAQPGLVPLPKWRKRQPPRRASTTALLNQLRAELWSHCLNPKILSHFSSNSSSAQNCDLIRFSLGSAVFNARN
jgi:hypothetical protein